MSYHPVSFTDYDLHPPIAGALNALIERTNITAERLAKTASELRGHADRLYGQLPEACAQSGPSLAPVHGGGLFGELSVALARLSDAEGEVTAQAQRNCNLA